MTELRRVIENYKETLRETEAAHTRETEEMGAVLAELRRNYYEQNHRAPQGNDLKAELEEAHRTISHLQLGLSKEGNDRTARELASIKGENARLRSECD